jgi:hypothetical protein
VYLSLEDLTLAVLEQIGLLEQDPKRIQLFFQKKEVTFFTD